MEASELRRAFRAKRDRDKPSAVAARVIYRIEEERGIRHGVLRCSRIRTKRITAARYDAVQEVYETCRLKGKPLSTIVLGQLFNLDPSSIFVALKKRGVL